jgi:murein DD-endopeptidase MepM/ murein hydrolase activator NlpD
MRALLIALSTLLAVPALGQSIRIEASPTPSYIEAGDSAQELNFDFKIDNPTASELLVQGIELSVFDAKGTLVHRTFVDRDSRRHAELLPDRKIAARGKLLLYNPFHTFGPRLPLHELKFRFNFVDDAKKNHTADITVRPTRFAPKTRLTPPLRGRILVWDGHDYASHHRRLDYLIPIFGIENQYFTNFQRYSFDFVLVDEHGNMSKKPAQNTDDFYRHKPENNTDYFGFGADVLATADGRVVELHDGGADDLRFDPGELRTRETAYGGNFIILDHGNGEFSWFGHLKQNSLRVKVGQQVKRGEVIGSVGASGSSLFPHLHYELRTGPGAGKADGLPVYFTDFMLRGERVTKPTPLNTGDVFEVR